jgi:hypothetical protein
MIYKFKDKGPHYGLGYVSGELVEFDEAKPIEASCLVPVVAKDSKGVSNPTGKMVQEKKKYTIDYLIEAGVITPANSEDQKKYKAQIEAEKARVRDEVKK